MNHDRPTEPLDEDGVNAIHDGAMRILEEIGIEFYNGTMFPPEYRGHAYIAEHGSWNREAGKVGYRVVMVRMENGRPSI